MKTPIKKRNNTKRNTTTRKKKENQYKREKEETVFSAEEFSSGEGFLTSIWGPALWHFLHTMSFNYPVDPTPENKKHYLEFVKSLEYVLPCKYCRLNLEKNFKELPLTMTEMENRGTFSLYIYNLHELINKMLGKKSGLTYNMVRERYEHFRARGCNKTRKVRKDLGCTKPLHGTKAKCIIKIVPQETKCDTFQMDKKCIKKRR